MRERYRSAMPYILGAYFIAVIAMFVFFNLRLQVEWVALVLFVAAIISGRAMLFLRDWGVFILVLLAWQLTSPIALLFPFPWHLQELIDADNFMFGGIVPPVWLQQHLYTPGAIRPWDILAVTMYMLHFLAPLLAGFVLWIVNRPLFQKYMITYVVVFLGGFATYILYPAVPPWMAAQPLVKIGHEFFVWYQVPANYPGGIKAAYLHSHIYLPGHVKNLFGVIMHNWYNPVNGTFYVGALHGHYDQVAAIPSEHAAYPLLFFLFLRRQFGKWGYLALIYIAALLFAITYLGQHYVIDAVIGFIYAGLGYAIVMHGAPAVKRAWKARYSSPEEQVAARPIRRPELEEA